MGIKNKIQVKKATKLKHEVRFDKSVFNTYVSNMVFLLMLVCDWTIVIHDYRLFLICFISFLANSVSKYLKIGMINRLSLSNESGFFFVPFGFNV